jgi:NAD-dependent dihydropyrimidine dehydrogenase PreA subunit
VAFIIAEPCVDNADKGCVAACPVDCIYEGDRMLYIHPEECIDCGACQPACPREAIFYDLEVPKKWRPFIAANTDFFESIGSPGGAAEFGKSSNDPQFVRDLPPMGT